MIVDDLTHGRELPQLDAGAPKHLSSSAIHAVALVVDDLADADLDDLDAAGEAGAGIAVEDGAGADALAAGLEQRVLLGVQAQAGGERGAAPGVAGVAARAAPLAAVPQGARRPVVPRAHDAVQHRVHQHAPHRPLHAVATPRRQRRQRHEVAVPARPQPVPVRQVQFRERRVQVRQVRRRVQEPHRRPRHYGQDPGAR